MFSRVLISLTLWLFAAAQSNNADHIYKFGDAGVTAAVATYRPMPEFTKRARKKKIQGVVKMDVVIGEDGEVKDVKLQNSLDSGLDANAVKALQTWKFTPCQKDGKPVRCAVYIEVSYHLY